MAPKSLAPFLWACFLLSCGQRVEQAALQEESRSAPERERAEAPGLGLTRQDLAGHYAGGYLVDLHLEADGTFESMVLTGLTADGCGTFEGAGGTSGSWVVIAGELIFEVEHETPGIEVSLRGARAWPTAKGLDLLTSAGRHALKAFEPRTWADEDSSTSR